MVENTPTCITDLDPSMAHMVENTPTCVSDMVEYMYSSLVFSCSAWHTWLRTLPLVCCVEPACGFHCSTTLLHCDCSKPLGGNSISSDLVSGTLFGLKNAGQVERFWDPDHRLSLSLSMHLANDFYSTRCPFFDCPILQPKNDRKLWPKRTYCITTIGRICSGRFVG